MLQRAKIPAKMTPKKNIDLVTPEADRQPINLLTPEANSSALSSYAATVTLSFDLTADAPLPVSARGIADNDNDRRGGEAHHDSDRPPDLPLLRETVTSSSSSSSVASTTNDENAPPNEKRAIDDLRDGFLPFG